MQLVTAGSATLDAPAAAAYARALAAGAPNSVTSSYRDPAAQLALYQAWVRRLPGYNFALHPSKSDHCKGLAIDLAGVKAKTWFRVHGREYGWLFTDGTEDWHIAYRPAYDRHTADRPAAPAAPALIPQEDEMARLLKHPNGTVAVVGPGPQMAVLHSVAEMDALRADGSVTGDLIDLGGSTLIWDLRARIARRAGVYSA